MIDDDTTVFVSATTGTLHGSRFCAGEDPEETTLGELDGYHHQCDVCWEGEADAVFEYLASP